VLGIFYIVTHSSPAYSEEAAGSMVGITTACAVVVEIVGGPESLQETFCKISKQTGSVAQNYALATIGVDYVFQSCCYIVQSFVPTGSPPMSGAPGTVTDEWVLRTFVIIFKRQAG
jgi:hypothetical protein